MLRDANGLTYIIVQSAIGAECGSADFFLSPKAESSNSMNPAFRPGAAKICVPITTIDRAISGGLPVPTIIKVDVETLEPEVLMGARNTIARYRPVITCEFLPRQQPHRIGAILSWLAYYGYHFYQVTNGPSFPAKKAGDVISNLNSVARDWILTPHKLNGHFFETNGRWMAALKASNRDTNQFLEAGTATKSILDTCW